MGFMSNLANNSRRCAAFFGMISVFLVTPLFILHIITPSLVTFSTLEITDGVVIRFKRENCLLVKVLVSYAFLHTKLAVSCSVFAGFVDSLEEIYALAPQVYAASKRVLLHGVIYCRHWRNPATRHNSKTGLLSLPPELRNIIWGYAVVQDSLIHPSTNDDITPSVTRVCRQMRAETITMYFSKNQFLFNIVDHDATAILRFRQVRIKYTTIRSFCLDSLSAGPSTPQLIAARKANFLRGCEAIWKGRTDFYTSESTNHGAPGSWIWRLFELCRTASIAYTEGIAWKQAEPVIVAAINAARVCGE
jgi:hypothetical protein